MWQDSDEKGKVAEKVKDVIENDIWGGVKNFLNLGFHVGEGQDSVNLTIGLLLLSILAVLLTSVLLRWIRKLVTINMNLEDKNKFTSIFKFIQYVVYLAVLLITLDASGINVTVLLTASAALFVGLGLALQELFQDVIGGMSIIMDKSLMVGDIIEVDERVGKIFEINLRTTRALTREDKVLIIPNHKFISNSVLSFTQNHKVVRESVKVGVAYGTDTDLVKTTLLSCVASQSKILKNPKPFVSFEDFGDSALQFGVYFFIDDSFIEPRIKSDLRFKIDSAFKNKKILIPFPQRDLHIYKKDLS